MNVAYKIPILSDFLLQPKLTFRSSVSTGEDNQTHHDIMGDYYQRKVAKVMQDVTSLIQGEPFFGYSCSGNMGGIGNTDLPYRVTLGFRVPPSNDLAEKIAKIEGVVHVKYIG